VKERSWNTLTLALGAIAAIAALSIAAIYGTVLYHIATNAYDATGDFLCFYAAGYLMRTGHGADLYDPFVMEATQRLLYPGDFGEAIGYPLPVFVGWLFAPLSLLPFTAAFFLYMSMMTTLFSGLLYLLSQQLRDIPKPVRRVFLACSALAFPSVAAIVFGQVDLVALAGLLGGYLLLREKRPGVAGLSLCLVLVKPHLLIGVAMLLIVRRQWKTIGTLALVGLPLLIVPALLAGPGTLIGNARALVHLDQQLLAETRVESMANWRGFIASVVNDDRLIYWAPGFLVIAAGATAIAVSRWLSPAREGALDRDYSLAVLLPLLVSPHLHGQTLVVGLLPGALFLRAYLSPVAANEAAARRAVHALLLTYTLLFALPFLAIQGVSLTIFLIVGVYLALSFNWPPLAVDSDSQTQTPARALERAA
jgi:hypothetical protein